MDNKTISESIKRVNTGEFSSIGFEKVEGNTLIDFDGNEYLDLKVLKTRWTNYHTVRWLTLHCLPFNYLKCF